MSLIFRFDQSMISDEECLVAGNLKSPNLFVEFSSAPVCGKGVEISSSWFHLLELGDFDFRLEFGVFPGVGVFGSLVFPGGDFWGVVGIFEQVDFELGVEHLLSFLADAYADETTPGGPTLSPCARVLNWSTLNFFRGGTAVGEGGGAGRPWMVG